MNTYSSSPKIFKNPFLAFLICVIAIFLSETVVMYIVANISPLGIMEEAFIDASFLTLTVIPLLYLFVYRPIRSHVSELKRAQEEWTETFNTIPDLILVTDDEYKIVNVNKAMLNRLGISRGEIIGRPCYEIMHGTLHPPDHCPHKKTLSDGKEHVREVYEHKLDGHFLVSSTPLYDSRHKTYGVVEVARDITKLKQLEERLQKEAITDELTGLYNRRGFTILSDQQFNVSLRNGERISLLYADLDNLKQINDGLGHAAGDKALTDISNVLRKNFRKADIIGRIGGDEFAVFMTHAHGADKIIIDNLTSNMLAFNKENKRDYELSLSIGIAHYDPENPCTFDELLSQADNIMYEQKSIKRRSRE